MTEILQANIFFLITALAIVVFTIFLCVAVFYVIKILKTVSNITRRIDAGSETIAEDIKQLKRYVAEGSLLSQIVGLFVKPGRGKSRRKSDD